VVNSGSQINQKHRIKVTNTGSLPLVMSSVSVLPDGNNDSPLNKDVKMNLDGWTGSVLECSPQHGRAPGKDYTFPFELSADLGNTDQGQTIRPMLTIGATEAPPSSAKGSDRGVTHIVPTRD
jgi:hypothetical protein